MTTPKRRSKPPPPAVERATRVVFTRVLTRVAKALRDHDLSLSQLAALHLIDQAGDMRVAALAEELGLSPSGASRFVDELVTRELVVRSEDPDDRRAKRVTLAPAGGKLLTHTGELRVQTIVEIMSEHAPPAVMDSVFAVMGRMKPR